MYIKDLNIDSYIRKSAKLLLVIQRYCKQRSHDHPLYEQLISDDYLFIFFQTGELIQTFPKIHGKGGATFLCYHDNHVYSAGRDGIYRMFVWKENGELELLNSNRVCDDI